MPASQQLNGSASPTESSPQKRRVTFHSNTQQTAPSTAASTALWVEKYAPRKASDLCIPPKKVSEVRSWIQAAVAGMTPCKLLILVGSPGTGKSTMIRVLADELALEVHEWSESHSTRLYGGRGSGILSVDQQSPLKSFQEFLKQTGVGYQSLTFSGLGSSMEVSDDGRKRKATFSLAASAGSLILLDELPNLHGVEAEQAFREAMTDHVSQTGVPTVLIFSNVREGRHRPEDLERMVHPAVLYSPTVQILQIHAATKPRMKKILDSVAKQEGIKLPPAFFESMHARSGGDLRYAITALQYEQTGWTAEEKQGLPPQADGSKKSERDTKLSTFHALGKLLYAKRVKGQPTPPPGSKSKVTMWNDGRPSLDFDPERVVEFSDIELSGTLSFVGYHSVEFFSDIGELSTAFEHFSDAALFVDCPSEGRHLADSVFPHAYAGSLAGRAVANANKHPTASKFRQFNAPKVFEVFRNRRANQSDVEQLKRRLCIGTGDLSLGSMLSPTSHFATDCLPFLQIIRPAAVSASLDKMHSNFRASHGQHEQEEDTKARLKEQQEILQLDDIADYDSDNDDVAPNATAKSTTTAVPKNPTSPTVSPTSAVGTAAATYSDGILLLDDD
jgi:cell cycle checkpoint protein